MADLLRDKPALTVINDPHAPVVFFDASPAYAHFNGIVAITLTAVLYSPTNDTTSAAQRAIVAHLRSNIVGMRALRDVIDKALLLAEPAESSTKN